MSYITVADIKDHMIAKEISRDPTVLDEAGAYVDNLAKSMDVNPVSIPTNPVPYPVQMLAVSYACMQTALRLTGDPDSAYVEKYKAYKADTLFWTNQMTADTLTGGKPSSTKKVFSIPLARC